MGLVTLIGRELECPEYNATNDLWSTTTVNLVPYRYILFSRIPQRRSKDKRGRKARVMTRDLGGPVPRKAKQRDSALENTFMNLIGWRITRWGR